MLVGVCVRVCVWVRACVLVLYERGERRYELAMGAWKKHVQLDSTCLWECVCVGVCVCVCGCALVCVCVCVGVDG